MRGYCVFGTVARNDTDAPLAYRVANWRYVTADGKRHRLRTKSQWVAVWKKLGTDFSFSILPDDITFEVGDWVQGFTTPEIAPGPMVETTQAIAKNSNGNQRRLPRTN